ncbi:MAG TPA: hypothetical protein VHH73_17135 [Verrucomicrobiae bacterium]|nr:hypothetical protein [Verrucomicrobiae bacterium]
MNGSDNVIGQAVFLRTDTPDYAEVVIPFSSLQEMVEIGTRPQPGMILERLVLTGVVDGAEHALTLGFVSATKGQRVGEPAHF